MALQTVSQLESCPVNTACLVKIGQLEKDRDKQHTLIQEIHAKVHNGFGSRITATNEKVDVLKSDLDQRFDRTDRAISKIQTSASAALISILVATIGLLGIGIAAIVTGLFGILEKLT